MTRKICFVTGSRADYGLLYWLLKDISFDKHFELQIIVTGMHLSPEFGNTYKQIEKDGFCINKKVDMQLTDDSEVGISNSMSFGISGFAKSFNQLSPDIILVLGDRFEIFSAVSAAMIARIPVVHLHGGETSEGVIDEPIRHSITKMSHLHFAATEDYRVRIIQLGEHPDRVFNVGGLGIDNINKLNLLTKTEFENRIDFELGKKNLLVTFHPLTLEKKASKVQFQELLNSLKNLRDTKIIFTKANSDTNGRVINKMIDDFVLNDVNAITFKSLGQLLYLSAMQFVDAVVGNSSSGLIEAPSFKIGTINIGDRQKGRTKAKSVITCPPNKDSIDKAFKKLYSKNFKNTLNHIDNPYGNGGASEKILEILKKTSFDNILKKSFYNIKNFN